MFRQQGERKNKLEEQALALGREEVKALATMASSVNKQVEGEQAAGLRKEAMEWYREWLKKPKEERERPPPIYVTALGYASAADMGYGSS